MLPFDADLTVKGLDKVLFDVRGQISFQTALFMQMYNDQIGQWAQGFDKVICEVEWI